MPRLKIGELLIYNKLITQKQFDLAMEQQMRSGGQPIGQVLCQMGFLKAKDLEYVLDHNKKRLRLGEILISQGLINEDKLNNALIISKEQKLPLGKALIKQQSINEEQIARAIASQHDLKFVSLTGVQFSSDLSGFVNATFAKRLQIVPIRYRDGNLTIAMAYPIQRDELTMLESWCKMPIIPVIAKESEIVIAQQKVFQIAVAHNDEHAELDIELSEDQVLDISKSKYATDFISADVDYLVKRIITTGIKDGCSDVHFESTENGMSIRYRLDGILKSVDLGNDDILISGNARQIVSKIKILCDMDISERRRPQDSSFKMKVSKDGKVRNVDFRVSTVPTQYGESVVIRILDKRTGGITLEGIGYSSEVAAMLRNTIDKPTGIFLVTGPTGSGKSFTLYAMLSHLNAPGVKILTIEDPIEYCIEGILQAEVNEIIGNTFAKLLRAFLRQDPDVIMVGEIRDMETASISMRAALTGHTVLSTLHTNDATSAVTRLIDMGVEPSLISATVRCALAQRLVRRICTECKIPYSPSMKILEEFGFSSGNRLKFVKGKGCPACNYSGFSGRFPIVELWIPTREELLLINRKPDNISLRKVVFSDPNRRTMFDDGIRHVLAGETTLEELLRTVPYEQIEAGRAGSAKLFADTGTN